MTDTTNLCLSDKLASQLIEHLGLPQLVKKMVLTFEAGKPIHAEVDFYAVGQVPELSRARFIATPVDGPLRA